MSESKESSVTPNTKIPIGAACAIIVTVLSVGWALSAKLSSIDSKFELMNQKIESLERGQHPDVEFRIKALEEKVSDFAAHGTPSLAAVSGAIEARLRVLEAALDSKSADRFTGHDMDEYIAQANAAGNKLPPRVK